MSQRNNQEDQFKNIVLKVQPIRQHSPDIASVHPSKPTSSPTNQSLPRNPSPILYQHLPAPQPIPPVEIATSHLIHRPDSH